MSQQQPARGLLTFEAEGNDAASSPWYSRHLHWPKGASGVTIGRGYDMKERTEASVKADLVAAGVDADLAAKYAKGAGLTGANAETFVTKNKDELDELTWDEQLALFELTYDEIYKDVQRISTKQDCVSAYGAVDFDKVDPRILDVVVDLRYRGDYSSATRKKVQKPFAENDYAAFREVMLDRSYWVTERGVPKDRFERRVAYLPAEGGAPVEAPDPGQPAPFELATMSEDQLYEHLKQAWKRAQERFGHTGDPVYDFQEENGRVNLIGARGLHPETLKPVENVNNAWDDTMFVLYKDPEGRRRAAHFFLSTEPNDAKNPNKNSTLKVGMHRYWLGHHHINEEWVTLSEYLDKYAGKKKKYRALKPVTSGVSTYLDADHDIQEDEGEQDVSDAAINIHYGGSGATPSGWSWGCQVLKGPPGYREFIKLVEADASIIGSKDNELSPKPAKDGDRHVIYLLVEGTFLRPPGVTFPLKGASAEEHYALNEGGQGGFFPIGANNFWHGGVHLDAEAPVCAVADGEVVAYRINQAPIEVTIGAEKFPLSSGFVLVQHQRATPKGAEISFFSLYMHLLPWGAYGDAEKAAPPSVFKKRTFTVATKEDGPTPDGKYGLNVRETGQGSKVLRIAPHGSELKFKEPHRVAPGGEISAGWHELEGGGWVYARAGTKPTISVSVVAEPDALDKVSCVKLPISAGSVVGYPGPYLTRPRTVHFEIFTGDVEFMKNPKGDKGGASTLKIPAGTALKKRTEKTIEEIAADLPAESRLGLLEQSGDHRKVACDQIVGWAPRSALGPYTAAGRYYTLEAPLATLSAEAGGGGASLSIDAKKGDKLTYLGESGDSRKVRFTLASGARDKLTGWAARKDLGDYSSTTKQYTLKAPLPKLYKQSPEAGFEFKEDAGKSGEEMFVDALPPGDPAVCKDKDGKLWQEVEYAPGQKGWVQREAAGVTTLCVYDWPRWRRVEEHGEYSADGLCDATDLVKLLDESGDGQVSSAEIAAALRVPAIAQRLRRLACLHPTEWSGEFKALDRLAKAPWYLAKEVLDATKDYIQKLGFWSDVKDVELPAKDKVWHLHPIGFLEHLRLLSTMPGRGADIDADDDGPPGPAEVYLLCEHEFDKHQRSVEDKQGRFEIVATASKGKDKVTVLHGGGGGSPAEIQVSCKGKKTAVKSAGTERGGELTRYSFDCQSQAPDNFNIVSGGFWKQLFEGTTYSVEGLGHPVSIIARPPHKWKLSVQFPAMRGLKVGSKLEKQAMVAAGPGFLAAAQRTTATIEVEKTGWKKLKSTETLTASQTTGVAMTPGGVAAFQQTSLTASSSLGAAGGKVKAVALSRDDQEISLEKVPSLKAFFSIVEIANDILGVIRAVQDAVPKVGWYAEFNLQVLQGTFAVEWQWKEHKDHRSFLWFKTGISLTLFTVSLEIGVGVSGCSFKAQIFAKLQGSVDVGLHAERVSPDAWDAVQIPMKATIKGAIGARFEAGSFVNVEASLETALELSGTFTINTKSGVSASTSLKWTGLKGTVTASLGKGGSLGSYTGEQTFIDEVDLGSSKWPEEKPYNPEYVARAKIKSILVEKIAGGWGIRVFTPSGSAFTPDRQWTYEEIAEKLTAKIDARRDIRRDGRSVEGLAHDIRQRLDAMGKRDWSLDWIDGARFERFVSGGELDALMTASYIDPCKEVLAKLGA